MSEVDKKKFRWKKWKWIGAIACVLLIVGYFSYASIIAMIIGRKLQNAIESHLHAVLQYDSLTYSFPFQVRMTNARLAKDDAKDGEELLTVERLDIRLARMPLPHRPLVVQNIEAHGPVLHLVRTAQGLAEPTDLPRSQEELREHPPQRQLSEMFELRKFAITDGRIIYEDRTVAGAEPMVFRGIAVDLGITPQSKAVYGFQFTTRQPPYADLAASGVIDIDAAMLDLSELTMSAQAQQANGESSLPLQVQKIINQLGISGKIEISGGGKMFLKDMGNSTLAGDIQVHNIQMDLPDQEMDLDDLDAQIHVDFHDRQTRLQLQQFGAQSGVARMSAQQAVAQLGDGRWKVEKLSGKIETISSGPTTKPATIGHAKVIAGSAEYSFDGSGDFKSLPKYSLAFHPVGLSLLPKGFADPIENITGNMQITESGIRFWNFSGDLLAGHVTAAGTIKMNQPTTYDADVSAQSIDLAQVAAMPAWDDRGLRLTGSADATAKLSGTLSHDAQQMLTDLKVQGESDITGINLWKSPVLTAIANTVGVQGATMTQGNGAFVCSIADRTVTFQHAAIHTKLLGLQGKGTIGFDAVANMDVIAAPLGDWRTNINSMKIPLIGDVAGNFAAGLQKMVSNSSRMLYEFQVTGTLPNDAKIKTIPAPGLTKGAANVFGGMLQGIQETDLLKLLKKGD